MAIGEFRTQFDEYLLPAGRGIGDPVWSKNGRQVVRVPDGRWLIAYAHTLTHSLYASGRTAVGRRATNRNKRLFLAVQAAPGGRVTPFGQPLLLAGQTDANAVPLLLAAPDDVLSDIGAPVVLLDGTRLTLLFSAYGSIWHTACDLPEPGEEDLLGEASRWRRRDGKPGIDSVRAVPGITLEDALLSPGGPLLLAGHPGGIVVLAGSDLAPIASLAIEAPARDMVAALHEQRLHVAFDRQR
jgi:hypothetical protein